MMEEGILVNATGPVEFRVERAPARMAVSGSGLLESWTGTDWDDGIAFDGSKTITSPGLYRLTLDVAGNASIQDS
jgi:hypothetical protein